MRSITIWSAPIIFLATKRHEILDRMAQAIALKLSLRIRYRVVLQEIGRATFNSPNILKTPLEEILKNLESPYKKDGVINGTKE